MQRRYGLGVLVVVAVLSLSLGAIAGAISGGVTAYMVESDSASTPESTVVAVHASSTATPVSTETPVATPIQTPVVSLPVEPAGTVSIADVVEQVTPAVVTVVNEQAVTGLFGGSSIEPAGTGTGFIIDDQGRIVTNNHVVEGSQALKVIFADGTESNATLLGTDSFADLAVIKVDDPVPAMVSFGDSEALRPGDQVIAIGSALGDFTNTVTEGIVSALNRSLQTPEGFNMEDMIQHDAPINPGNSGGPLFALNGHVVGVNTAVVRQAEPGVTAEGLGFAIPSKTVEAIAKQLIENGRVERPFIGVTYEPLTPRAAAASNLNVDHGVLVREVQPGSPAANAGIQVDDVITKINDAELNEDNPLVNELFKHKVGDTVKMEIYRPSLDQTLTLDVTLGARPDNP